MKPTLILYLQIVLIFNACSQKRQMNFNQIVETFYQTYNKRQEINDFIAFYDKNIVFEDVINGDKIAGKEGLKVFFDWSNPKFKSLEINHLIVKEIIIHNNKAVIKGYFTRFKWDQDEFGEMDFITILTFNEFGKIIEHEDWINYPISLISKEINEI